MGVYVILDGVRREYPEAIDWISTDNSLAIRKETPSDLRVTANFGGCDVRHYPAPTVIAQYGRYDLVGWMEEKE